MMTLQCPWCGERPEREFHFGGTTAMVRPPLDCDDEGWARYLFFRDNPKGAHAERWRHTYGCRQWFNVRRDTVSHHIDGVFGMGKPTPAGDAR
jgi:sarcosine oxidase, subunit delta